MSRQPLPQSSSGSFSWSSLTSAKRKISDSEDNSTTKELSNHKNKAVENEEALNSIKEASNENSESSSKKPGITPANGNGSKTEAEQDNGKVSNWWFWNEMPQDEHRMENTPVRETNNVQGSEELEWSAPYKRVSSALTYYYGGPSSEMKNQENENTPLILNNDQSQSSRSLLSKLRGSDQSTSTPNKDPKIQASETLIPTETYLGGWFSWFWNSTDKDDSDDDTSDPELFKMAKSAIENSKDSSHYAFKSSANNKYTHEFELAVSDTRTENQPVKHSSKKRPITPNEIQEKSLQVTTTPVPAESPQTSNSFASNTSPVSPIGKANSGATTPEISKLKNNLIIPQVEENYRTITLITKLRLLGEHALYHHKTSESHLYRLDDAKIQKKRVRIRKVVIVAIHEFLPLKMVKTLIGQSTGNSVGFIDKATKAVKRWLKENSIENGESTSLDDYDIQTIALEGEGIIEDRVEKLFKLLENWIDVIAGCDFLFFVSHSQGTPIAIHLLAKLLEQYANIKSNKRIGLLSMSGIFLGPLTGLNSKLVIRAYTTTENQIIKELFEFQKPNSVQSIKLTKSMQILVNQNVKLTFAGSINDQWIPIFSAVSSNFSHPNIFKCVHVDKQADLPKFVVSLMKIILIMKNMGYSDHNLLRDLSEKCMGSLADGGHCNIYHDENVYLTAVRHTLETTSLVQTKPLSVTHVPNNKQQQGNLFHLPWNVRGLLNDLLKIKNISNVLLIKILIKDFQEWEPTLKKWKDLKYCFDAFEEIELDDLFL